MIRTLLALLLLAACDGPAAAPPSQPPPPTSTPVTADKPAADKPDDGAGFASPKQADDDAEPAPPTGAPPDAELVARIKERFGDRCRYERACGDLVGVDCDSAVDGPYYYVTRKDLTTVSTCGGACRRGCTDCPPKAWTCPTY